MNLLTLMRGIATPSPSWMTGQMHKHDPRTVILATMHGVSSDNRSKVLLAQGISDSLAEWIDSHIEHMAHDDPRLPGYADLVERLTIR